MGEGGQRREEVGGGGRRWAKVGEGGRRWEVVGGGGRRWEMVGEGGRRWEKVSAPISEGAKSMHRARLLGAAERDDQRYWNSHSYHAFRGKNNVWNIQQPKFQDSIRTRKGRNPTPTRIQQQFKVLAKTKTIFED